jgi:hypothetical protein
MTRDALGKQKKKGDSAATWAKLKYDRQIVAIAKVYGATNIYSDDSDIRTMASKEGIKVIGLADLPVPNHARHTSFQFPPSSAEAGPVAGG